MAKRFDATIKGRIASVPSARRVNGLFILSGFYWKTYLFSVLVFTVIGTVLLALNIPTETAITVSIFTSSVFLIERYVRRFVAVEGRLPAFIGFFIFLVREFLSLLDEFLIGPLERVIPVLAYRKPLQKSTYYRQYGGVFDTISIHSLADIMNRRFEKEEIYGLSVYMSLRSKYVRRNYHFHRYYDKESAIWGLIELSSRGKVLNLLIEHIQRVKPYMLEEETSPAYRIDQLPLSRVREIAFLLAMSLSRILTSGELRQLAFHLDIDYESLPDRLDIDYERLYDRKERGKAYSLIMRAYSSGQFNKLLKLIREYNPWLYEHILYEIMMNYKTKPS